MNIKDNDKIKLLTKYKSKIDLISEKYQYTNNIKHLLYIIIPAFVIKYGLKEEPLILNCLNEVPIFITGKEDPKYQALYISYPIEKNNEIKIKKQILLNRYEGLPYLNLIDNIIHEFNHAVNSFKKSILYKDNNFYLRTGLSTIKYDLNNFKKIEKSKEIILEEIINSKQTETIIEIIKSLSSLQIENIEIQNALLSIKGSIKDKYTSNSYYVLKHYCQTLLNNQTFFLTLENLRINGNIFDIEDWFNHIYGSNKYQTLINLLYNIYELQNKEKVLFKVKKIKKIGLKIIKLSEIFNQNCHIK